MKTKNEGEENGKEISGFYEASTTFAYMTGAALVPTVILYGEGHYVWGTVAAIGTLLFALGFSGSREKGNKAVEDLSESIKKAYINNLEKKLEGGN